MSFKAKYGEKISKKTKEAITYNNHLLSTLGATGASTTSTGSTTSARSTASSATTTSAW